MNTIFYYIIITITIYSQEFIENKTVFSDFYKKVKIANLLGDTKSLVKKNRTKVFREGLFDRGMNVCRDEDFYTPPTSVTTSENIIAREKIPGEEKRLPSSISLKLSPDTTCQGQMITLRIDIFNNSDSVLTIFRREGLRQEIKDKKSGKIIKSDFNDLGDNGIALQPGEFYTILRSPLQQGKKGLSEIKKPYSYWNYWPAGEYSYTIKYVFGTSEVVSNSVDFVIKPIPETGKEAFETLIAIANGDKKYTNYNPATGYDEYLEKTCERYKNSIFEKEFHQFLFMVNYYHGFFENENIEINEKELIINKMLGYIKNYPDDYLSFHLLRKLVFSEQKKDKVNKFISQLLAEHDLMFGDKIIELKNRINK